MARESIPGQLAPSRLNIGLSATIGLTAIPGQVGVYLRYVSGGSLVELVDPNLGVSWNQGMILPSQLQSLHYFPTSANLYFATQGATTVLSAIQARLGYEGATNLTSIA